MRCFAKRPSRVSRGKNGCIIADWILLSKYPFGVKLGHTRIGMVTDPGWAGQGMGLVMRFRISIPNGKRALLSSKLRKKERTEREKNLSRKEIWPPWDERLPSSSPPLSPYPVIVVCMRVRMCPCGRETWQSNRYGCFAPPTRPVQQGIHPWVAQHTYVPISGAKRL